MSYTDSIQRVLEDFHHWGHMGMAGVEYTVTYGYFDAEPEVMHFRIAKLGPETTGHKVAGWYSIRLDAAHGEALNREGHPDRIRIQDAVISRIRSIPGTFAQEAPTRKFVEAFYGMH